MGLDMGSMGTSADGSTGSKHAPHEERVAVVFVHGQGEQRPMKSVRELARTTWATDRTLSEVVSMYGRRRRLRLWSTPNPLSRLLELRRLSTENWDPDETTEDGARPLNYDFYEFYWAHLMKGNRILHVWDWFLSLIRRPYSHIPSALKPVRQGIIRLLQLFALFAAAFSLLTAGLVVRFEGKPPTCATAHDFVDYVAPAAEPVISFIWPESECSRPESLPITVNTSEIAEAPPPRRADLTAENLRGPRQMLLVTGEFVSRVVLLAELVILLPIAFAWLFLFQRRWEKRDEKAFRDRDIAPRSPTEVDASAKSGHLQKKTEQKLSTYTSWQWPVAIGVLVYLFIVLLALSPSFDLRDIPVASGAATAAVFVFSQYINRRVTAGDVAISVGFIVAAFTYSVMLWEVADGQILVALTVASMSCIWLTWRMQYRPALIAAGFTILAAITARSAMADIAAVHEATFTIDWIMPVAWGFVTFFAVGFVFLTLSANDRFRRRLFFFLIAVVFAVVGGGAVAVTAGLVSPPTAPFGLVSGGESGAVQSSAWPSIFRTWSEAFYLAEVDRYQWEDVLSRIVTLQFFLTSIVFVAGLTTLVFVVVANRAFLSPVMGDSARYLRDRPGNIEERQSIRRAGVELLERLHEEGYERIIVVGHSLGSVVAYDMLTLLWGRRFSELHASEAEPALTAVEEAARALIQGQDEAKARQGADALTRALQVLYGRNVAYQPKEGPIVIEGDQEARTFEFKLLENRRAIDQAVAALANYGGRKPFLEDREPRSVKEHCRRIAVDLRTGPNAYQGAAQSVRALAQSLKGARARRAGPLLATAAECFDAVFVAHIAFRDAQLAYFNAVKPMFMAAPTDPQEAAARRVRGEMMESGTQPVWRVSDFVTLGSPLNFGPLLLAESYGDFAMAKRDGELPTCPPFLDVDSRRSHATAQQVEDLRFAHQQWAEGLFGTARLNAHFGPNHSAVFAPVRWTNLFFVQENLVAGDLIGGPCWRHFDYGVTDVAIDRRDTGRIFAHNEYWTTQLTNEDLEALMSDGKLPRHLRILREALDLKRPTSTAGSNGVPDETPS